MTTKAHKLLTGTDLHEPKGIETQPAGKVYVSDGAGSGTWVSISIDPPATTGDIKPTMKNVADTGWVMFDQGTIGNASSAATSRANADTSALFQLLWNNCSDLACPVVGGRGGSAAADFAANKKITLPRVVGRSVGSAGNTLVGEGIASRGLGTYSGSPTVTLVQTNLPNYFPSGIVTVAAPGFNSPQTYYGPFQTGGTGVALLVNPSGASGVTTVGSVSAGTVNAPTAGFVGDSNGGASVPFSIIPPTVYFYWMIKL